VSENYYDHYHHRPVTIMQCGLLQFHAISSVALHFPLGSYSIVVRYKSVCSRNLKVSFWPADLLLAKKQRVQWYICYIYLEDVEAERRVYAEQYPTRLSSSYSPPWGHETSYLFRL